MRLSTNWVAAAALVLTTATGCATTMADFMEAEDFVVSSAKLRGARIDEKASTLDWQPETFMEGVKTGDERAGELRAELAKGFNQVLAASDGKPARFRVTVLEVDRQGWPTAPCLAVLILFGCPNEIIGAKVDLELEVEGEIYKESGESSSVRNIYSNGSYIQAADEVAAAVVDAMRKIDSRLSGAR